MQHIFPMFLSHFFADYYFERFLKPLSFIKMARISDILFAIFINFELAKIDN